MFFFHYRRRRDPPVYLSGSDSRCSLKISNTSFICCRAFFTYILDDFTSIQISRYKLIITEKCIEYDLHKETIWCSSTIGDDGIRQYASVAAILAAVLRFQIHNALLVEHCWHKSSTIPLQYIFRVINCLQWENVTHVLQRKKWIQCNLHKETIWLTLTIVDDGTPQWGSDAAILDAVLPFRKLNEDVWLF
mgnify:CR=1 FL=1